MTNLIKKRNHSSTNFNQVMIQIVLFILMVMVLAPLYFLIVKSFKTPNQDVMSPFGISFPFELENYKIAWLVVKDFLLNTLLIATIQTVGIIIICSLAAFGFSRFNFPYKKVIFTSILGLMMIPGTLTLIPRFQLVINVFGLKNSIAGVILPSIASSLPLGIYLIYTFFKGLPGELFEAAEMDGASKFRQYLTIAIPLSTPILATLGLMSFMSAWNDLLWPRLILQEEALHTISIGLVPFTESYYSVNGSFGVPFAGYVIVSLPLVIIFLFTSKQFIKGLTSGAFKF